MDVTSRTSEKRYSLPGRSDMRPCPVRAPQDQRYMQSPLDIADQLGQCTFSNTTARGRQNQSEYTRSKSSSELQSHACRCGNGCGNGNGVSTNLQQNCHPGSPANDTGRDGEAYYYGSHVGVAESPLPEDERGGGWGGGHSGSPPLHNSSRFMHQDLTADAGERSSHSDPVFPTSGRPLSLEGGITSVAHTSQKSGFSRGNLRHGRHFHTSSTLKNYYTRSGSPEDGGLKIPLSRGSVASGAVASRTSVRHSIPGANAMYQISPHHATPINRNRTMTRQVTGADVSSQKIDSQPDKEAVTASHSSSTTHDRKVCPQADPRQLTLEEDLTMQANHKRSSQTQRRHSTSLRRRPHVYEQVAGFNTKEVGGLMKKDQYLTAGGHVYVREHAVLSDPSLSTAIVVGKPLKNKSSGVCAVPAGVTLSSTHAVREATPIDHNSTRQRDDESVFDEVSSNKRAAVGSRGKSAGSVMMKLAKKFSKKNFPIVRDDDYIEAIGEEVRKIRTHSNSVSDLDSLGRMRRRSLSLEHLETAGRDNVRPGSSEVPTTSPSLVRTWSKVGNKKNSEHDAESIVSTNLYRVGSKKNLTGNPSEVLFEAIEQGNVEAVTSLIDATLITKFNTVNDDNLLPVDLSAMLGQHSITKLLLSKGAKDSSKFCRDPYLRLARIKALIKDAGRGIHQLQEDSTALNVANSSSGGGIGSSGSGVKELEKKFKKAERKSHLCNIMLSNYEKAGPPGLPTNVQLHVTSSRSLMVTFSEPEDVNFATVTRYKIEWCHNEDFKPVGGDFVMTDLRATEYVIPDLDKDQKYYVRVSSYNMKGFGSTQVSCPIFACPSSWHDLDSSKPRYEGCTDNIHLIAAQFGHSMQGNVGTQQQSGAGVSSNASLLVKTKSVKKVNPLSRRFTSAVKFHRSLKAGVYIASLFYSDESKLLVTTDDQIPIVEVADATGTSIGQDFVWLANLACTWEHVQAMADITDSYTSSPGIQFRNLLLHAVLDMQNALGVTDLGLLHPFPYKDSQGAIVFVIVQYVSETKTVASGNSSLKWTDVPRLWKRRGTPSRSTDMEVLSVPEQLVMDAQEMMSHHCSSVKPMSRGLYLGYLRGRSSVASMKVICPRAHPSVLPHLKIRNNPNISSDEWEWLTSLRSSSCPLSLRSSCPQSLQQTLLPTLHLFLMNLGLSQEEAELHQLYVHEAIELNEEVTILLVLPPPEQVCTAPGSSDHFMDRPDFVALPISTFEIMQLYTYQRSFMTKFSVVRARVDVELLASLHKLREAFSKEEVTEAKEKKNMLENFHSRTDQVWKQMRWLEDAVQKSRDHEATSHTHLHVASIIKSVEQQGREAEETREKEEDGFLYSEIGQGTQRPMPEVTTAAVKRASGGHLRVILSYRTGLVRGSIVKLYVESTTTSVEVVRLVVNQVAVATCTPLEKDLSDYYLVAGVRDKKEWVLEKDHHPLQLQMNTAEHGKDKVFLMVKKKSEDEHLNQMVTNV